MSMDQLVNCYILYKKEQPSHVNDLLDYIQLNYFKGKLSSPQYRTLLKEVSNRSAVKPDYFLESTNMEAVY
ncbi:YppF family protein [Alkalihalobacterium alkalinitrilicum]|uniref:YppF family protein n=1 Tax=Alkalihalobacterium alkalinitrilicum TaxID=427920 RepID=UPI001302F9A9|nr:YppF family protein [Alkalihalobacterium alkalinitrilicum]